MDKNIVLVGFMGTGKTSIAKKIAEKLDREFIEMDSLIEEREQMSINEIFKIKGESYFRSIENAIVKELTKKNNLVISTGGGIVLNPDNIDSLEQNGLLICLDADPEEIYRRVSREQHRPLLEVSDPLKKIRELLDFRKPYYDKVFVHINTNGKSIDAIVKDIEKLVNEYK